MASRKSRIKEAVAGIAIEPRAFIESVAPMVGSIMGIPDANDRLALLKGVRDRNFLSLLPCIGYFEPKTNTIHAFKQDAVEYVIDKAPELEKRMDALVERATLRHKLTLVHELAHFLSFQTSHFRTLASGPLAGEMIRHLAQSIVESFWGQYIDTAKSTAYQREQYSMVILQEIIAIGVETIYSQWTDCESEMVRYKFRDSMSMMSRFDLIKIEKRSAWIYDCLIYGNTHAIAQEFLDVNLHRYPGTLIREVLARPPTLEHMIWDRWDY